LISGYLGQKNKLPVWVRDWLKRIGDQNISDAVQRAANFNEISSEEKRKQAVLYLQEISINKFGFPVPVSIANLLVENAYQILRRKKI
jgi:hypothetical protein